MTQRKTRVLPVSSIQPPHLDSETSLLDWWCESKDGLPQDQVSHLLEAARALQASSTPVAFPTETVYGLGADATRSEAVRGIYVAKQRPSDNPLIVHVGSLDQLRALLRGRLPAENDCSSSTRDANGTTTSAQNDSPIPSIYHPLIQKFWPGPLTLLFRLPTPSPFAAEVTNSLSTVGIRMPSSPLARLLISLSDRPLAAPSANASTRPSPTTAAHVLHDLDGRIEMILDGGSCEVGVESTVVDGSSNPPAVLRPGGVGIEEIRALGGIWADIVVGYQDRDQSGITNGVGDGEVDVITNGSAVQSKDDSMNGNARAPRAPGMKYRHYAPRARVLLFEKSSSSSSSSEHDARAKILSLCTQQPTSPPQERSRLTIGVLATQTWQPDLGLDLKPTLPSSPPKLAPSHSNSNTNTNTIGPTPTQDPDRGVSTFTFATPPPSPRGSQIHSMRLGPDIRAIARGLFAALRTLDARGCDVILIEGVAEEEEEEEEGDPQGDPEGTGEEGMEGDSEGGRGTQDLLAAVMNRLRKAAAS